MAIFNFQTKISERRKSDEEFIKYLIKSMEDVQYTAGSRESLVVRKKVSLYVIVNQVVNQY